MARPPLADLKLREAVSRELNKFVAANSRLSKAAIARSLGITKQALSKYLQGDSTPSAETLVKLTSVPGIQLSVENIRLKPSSFPTLAKPAPVRPEAVQELLPFDEPIVIGSEHGEVTLDIRKKPSKTIQLTVRLKLSR